MKFETVAAAMAAHKALNGRWFAGRNISVEYQVIHPRCVFVGLLSFLASQSPAHYALKFPQAP